MLLFSLLLIGASIGAFFYFRRPAHSVTRSVAVPSVTLTVERYDAPEPVVTYPPLERFQERGEPLESVPELHNFVIRQYEKKAVYRVFPREAGHYVAIGYTPDSYWLDVVSRKRRKGDGGGYYTGAYAVSGFTLVGQRWSYGEGPPGARELRALVTSLFPQQ
jgi:hypothetical protein